MDNPKAVWEFDDEPLLFEECLPFNALSSYDCGKLFEDYFIAYLLTICFQDFCSFFLSLIIVEYLELRQKLPSQIWLPLIAATYTDYSLKY